MLILQPILVAILVGAGTLKWPMLIVVLGIPSILQAIKVFREPRPTEKPADFPAEHWPTYLAGHAFRSNRVMGSLFVLGLIVSIFIK